MQGAGHAGASAPAQLVGGSATSKTHKDLELKLRKLKKAVDTLRRCIKNKKKGP